VVLETYREMISFFKDMASYLQTLKDAKSVCKAVMNAMSKFSYDKVSFADEVEEFKEMLMAANTLNEIIGGFEKAITQAEKRLGEAEGIDAKVIYMRDIEKKRLYEIADEMNYSEGYIRNISARNPRKGC